MAKLVLFQFNNFSDNYFFNLYSSFNENPNNEFEFKFLSF